MQKISLRIFLPIIYFSFCAGLIPGEKIVFAETTVLDSGEKKQGQQAGGALTVGQFFMMQSAQFQSMRPMMERKLAENLLPTSPVYQKMLRANELNQAMLAEFIALTQNDPRPMEIMMDSSSDLYARLLAVWQKYEPLFQQLTVELAPYETSPPVMAPPFIGHAPPADFQTQAAETPQAPQDSSPDSIPQA